MHVLQCSPSPESWEAEGKQNICTCELCVNTHTHTHTHIYTETYIHNIHSCTHIQLYTQICTYYIYTYTCICTHVFIHIQGFPGDSEVKDPPANAGDMGLIPGLGRSPGGGNGNTLQYSCLENSIDRRAWQAAVHWVTRVTHD